MKKLLITLIIAAGLIAHAAPKEEPLAMPKVGGLAPDFKMAYFDGHDLKEVSLSQYHGQKQVILAFYIFAFTGG
jgi:hypothetical protein